MQLKGTFVYHLIIDAHSLVTIKTDVHERRVESNLKKGLRLSDLARLNSCSAYGRKLI